MATNPPAAIPTPGGGGGGGDIARITSTDGSVTITDPIGPTTDLSSNKGTISEITSIDGSVMITDNAGPSTDLSIENGAAVPGRVLATAEYLVPTTYYLAETLTLLDAVYATLAFSVPANGIVDIDVDIAVTLQNTTPFIVQGAIGLLDHTTGLQVGILKSVGSVFNGITGQYTQLSIHNRFHLTGMTPGACQLDLAGVKTDNGGTSVVQVNVGTSGLDASPILIQASASV